MKTSLGERDGNTVKFAVEVSREELEEAFNTRVKKLARDVRIPGFRPGKAPLAMVRQRLGDEAILVDTVEESMAGWYAEAVKELDLDPIERPRIELDNDIPEMDKPLGFTATVTVMPEVVLGEYKGVGASREPVDVADEEVDAQTERLRNEFAELRPVTGRPVQKGDYVTVDVHATFDGKPVEGLEASDYVFDVGGDRMFPEIDEQVIGMDAEEERAFPFTLPEGFPVEEMGGKTVNFTILIKEIKEKVLPPLTDRWASEVSEFATLLELRQDIRGKIRLNKSHASDQRFRALAVNAAVENATLDLPDVVVHEKAQELLGDFQRSLESQGGSLEAYIEATGTSAEKIIEDMKPQAANNVKTRLVLDAIAKAEALELTDAEVEAVVTKMATVGKVEAEVLERQMRESGQMEVLREQLLRDKAVDVIVASAVEQAPEEASAETAAQEGPEPEPEASGPAGDTVTEGT